MQIKSLRIKSYKSWPVNASASDLARCRLKALERVDKLRKEGCSLPTALQAIGCSRATYYRWRRRYQQQGLSGLDKRSSRPHQVRRVQWNRQHEQQVLRLRQRHPLWGKRKLWKVLNRDHDFTWSIRTVGRIVHRLLQRRRIRPASFYYGRVKSRRPRRFTRHAKRWKRGMKARQPGEWMQVDHMSVSLGEGITLKEFKATCPVTGITILRVYHRATSRNASHFLAYLIEQLPFQLMSIQVDGGSEFQDEFETACKNDGIALAVLPPKSPQLNGCVERANGTSRYEFYPFYQGPLTVKAINQELAQYQRQYNDYRPHDGIGLETPMSYYQQLVQAA